MKMENQFEVLLKLKCSSEDQQDRIIAVFRDQFPTAIIEKPIAPPPSVPSVEEIHTIIKLEYGIFYDDENMFAAKKIHKLIAASTHGYSEKDMRGLADAIWKWQNREDDDEMPPLDTLDDMGKKPMGTDIVPLDEVEILNRYIVSYPFVIAPQSVHHIYAAMREYAKQSKSLAIEEVKGSDTVAFANWIIKRVIHNQ